MIMCYVICFASFEHIECHDECLVGVVDRRVLGRYHASDERATRSRSESLSLQDMVRMLCKGSVTFY